MQLPTESVLLRRPTELGGHATRSLIAGVVGLVLMAAGYLMVGDEVWLSYLIAYFFWIGLTLGSLAVLMVQYLSGGAWGLVSRRILEAGTRTLPLMIVAFIPIWWQLPVLYARWAGPEAATDAVVQTKAVYLNPSFWTLRAILFFVIWGALIFVLNKWSQEQDAAAPRLPGPADRRFRVLSGPGLVIYMLTVTFMSVDWVMSLDPHWYSTIFGILTVGGQGLSAMAFTIIVLAALVKFQPMSSVVQAEQVHDLSKLMFAFVLLWAYFSVSQLIIIWSGNLPEEIPYYLERLHGPWYFISVLVLIGHFVLPFLLLLSRDFKRNPASARNIAIFIFLMRIVDVIWSIAPAFRHEGSPIHWLDFAAVLGLGGLWLFVFFRTLSGRALVPARDPYFKEALAHGGH